MLKISKHVPEWVSISFIQMNRRVFIKVGLKSSQPTKAIILHCIGKVFKLRAMSSVGR